MNPATNSRRSKLQIRVPDFNRFKWMNQGNINSTSLIMPVEVESSPVSPAPYSPPITESPKIKMLNMKPATHNNYLTRWGRRASLVETSVHDPAAVSNMRLWMNSMNLRKRRVEEKTYRCSSMSSTRILNTVGNKNNRRSRRTVLEKIRTLVDSEKKTPGKRTFKSPASSSRKVVRVRTRRSSHISVARSAYTDTKLREKTGSPFLYN